MRSNPNDYLHVYGCYSIFTVTHAYFAYRLGGPVLLIGPIGVSTALLLLSLATSTLEVVGHGFVTAL